MDVKIRLRHLNENTLSMVVSVILEVVSWNRIGGHLKKEYVAALDHNSNIMLTCVFDNREAKFLHDRTSKAYADLKIHRN